MHVYDRELEERYECKSKEDMKKKNQLLSLKAKVLYEQALHNQEWRNEKVRSQQSKASNYDERLYFLDKEIEKCLMYF